MSNNIISESGAIPKWEDLPKELLQIIGKHLDSRIDVFRFRAVSSSWRSLLPPSYLQSSNSPPITLPPPLSLPVQISIITICRLQSLSNSSACLVKVIESDSGQLQLLSVPSAETQIRHFIGTTIRKSLNMLNFRLIELAKAHVLSNINTPLSNPFKKVVMFGNKGLLALYNFTGKLGFWAFGHKHWTSLGQQGTHYDDILFFNNHQYYVVDNLGIISWIDSSLNLIQYSPALCGFGQMKTLVQSQGSFYIVDSYMEDEDRLNPLAQPHNVPQAQHWLQDRRTVVDMKVFKLDEEWGMWVEVKSLGDRVFVLGKEVNFSVDVADYPGCMGNCIYFIDRHRSDRSRKIFVTRFFRLEDGNIRNVECFPTYKRLFSPAMMFPFSTSSDD